MTDDLSDSQNVIIVNFADDASADFGWSSLVMELVEPDPRAGSSFLSA